MTLRKACEKSHGHAIDAFVQHVAKRPKDQIRQHVAEIVDEFVSSLDLPVTDLPLAHAAENFGVLLAGGLLAIEGGVVPWSEKRLRRALRNAFNGFRRASQRGEDATRKARRTLRKTLTAVKLDLVRKASTLTAMPRTGFRTKRDGETTYIISSKTFSNWFTTAQDARAALVWLHQKGLLRTAENKTASIDSKAWAETTLKIADGKKVQVVEFRPPAFAKKG